MNEKEKYFIDLSKCSEDERKHIYSIIHDRNEFLKPDSYTHDCWKMLNYSNIDERWHCSGENWDGLKNKTELTYSEFIKLFEEPKKLPSELLKDYFKNTPREQVLKDWESTAEYDNVNSPKVLELFEGGEGEILPDVAYWRNRCLLAEKCLSESPCDPDITNEQINAHNSYNEFIEAFGNKD